MTDTIEQRVAWLEAVAAIRNLAARYCFSIDDHDLDVVAQLFTTDAMVRSADGVMSARGVPAIIDQYRLRFAVLGVSNHVTHHMDIEILSEHEARGRVSAHAELWRNGRMMVTALRYDDRYRQEDGAWRFAERVLSFLYYIPVEDYAVILGARDRNRAYDRPMDADYPEKLASWAAYEASRA